jgi:hypothetical protein
MVEGHLLEQRQCCAKLLADRRACVLSQNLLDEGLAVEGGRRDRGVGVRSKVALIHPRHECGEQFSLSHRPFGGASHDSLRVR